MIDPNHKHDLWTVFSVLATTFVTPQIYFFKFFNSEFNGNCGWLSSMCMCRSVRLWTNRVLVYLYRPDCKNEAGRMHACICQPTADSKATALHTRALHTLKLNSVREVSAHTFHLCYFFLIRHYIFDVLWSVCLKPPWWSLIVFSSWPKKRQITFFFLIIAAFVTI